MVQVAKGSRFSVTITAQTEIAVGRVDRGGRAERGRVGKEENAALEAAAGRRLG